MIEKVKTGDMLSEINRRLFSRDHDEAVVELREHFGAVGTMVKYLESKEKAGVISDMVNDFSFDPSEVAEYLMRQHPTLQQNVMRLCAEYIRKQSQNKYTDLRNEATVAFAKKCVNECGDQMYFPHV